MQLHDAPARHVADRGWEPRETLPPEPGAVPRPGTPGPAADVCRGEADEPRAGQPGGGVPHRGGPTTKLRGGEDGETVRTPDAADRSKHRSHRRRLHARAGDVETRGGARRRRVSAGDRPGTATVPGAAARAPPPSSASYSPPHAPSSRAWTRANERVGRRRSGDPRRQSLPENRSWRPPPSRRLRRLRRAATFRPRSDAA